MTLAGSDLLKRCHELGLGEEIISWLLPRSTNNNHSVAVDGILLSATLRNRVVGEALSKGMNVILTSDYNSQALEYPPLIQIYEVCYKNELFVLQWKMSWLFESQTGSRIMGKILQADLGSVYRNNLLSFTYKKPKLISAVFQRVGEPMLFQKFFAEAPKVEEVLVIPEWNENILDRLLGQPPPHKRLVLCFDLQSEALDLLLQMGYLVLRLHPVQLLNEVNRELYYLLKRGYRWEVDYEINVYPKLV